MGHWQLRPWAWTLATQEPKSRFSRHADCWSRIPRLRAHALISKRQCAIRENRVHACVKKPYKALTQVQISAIPSSLPLPTLSPHTARTPDEPQLTSSPALSPSRPMLPHVKNALTGSSHWIVSLDRLPAARHQAEEPLRLPKLALALDSGGAPGCQSGMAGCRGAERDEGRQGPIGGTTQPPHTRAPF